ncbi:GMC family oxidoreductase N-terminal domain-containing protein [Sphingobium sp. EM0848]|uniref:GMC family oxidoreductase n=1 Tax=Sphingobium sp. EM0848 TaxID=2743473 RepID=UPI001C3F62E8
MEFDYIVVGAGSAGCVLANRLSADRANRVCLIEAGPRDSSPLIHVPIGIVALLRHKRLNWRFSTLPQPLAGGRRVYVPRGKVLGGTSAINGMVYLRGDPRDYDDWADAGNAGWAFRDVLPYFLRSENNEVWTDSPFHGTGGLLPVSDLRSHNPASASFIEAARQHQIPLCPDFNAPLPDGVGLRQFTQRNGKRMSTATAFLKPALNRPNLTVLTDCLADKIVFDGKIATGVRVLRDGTSVDLSAKREVILAGGAIGSPEILLRSGIGEAAHLQGLGIDVVHSLPGVGRNLHDHCAVALHVETKSTIPYGISVPGLPRLAWEFASYVLHRRGLLASSGVEAAAFVRSSPELARTDLQLGFAPGKHGNPRTGSSFGYGHGYSVTAILLRPWSRGEVRLTDRSPRSAPAIDPRFFTDERDLDLLVRGVQLSRRLLNSEPFKVYRGEEILPGEAVATEDEIRDYIRSRSGTAFHPVGTCAMGSGPDAVVDTELAVHGVQKLRVVDASIMPKIIGGNTNAPTIMIAEKAADMILGKAPAASMDLPDCSIMAG